MGVDERCFRLDDFDTHVTIDVRVIRCQVDLLAHGADMVHHPGEIDPWRSRGNAESLRCADRMGDPGDPDQCLARHAPVPCAVPPESTALDEQRAHTEVRSDSRRRQSCGSAADHRQIIVVLHNASDLLCPYHSRTSRVAQERSGVR